MKTYCSDNHEGRGGGPDSAEEDLSRRKGVLSFSAKIAFNLETFATHLDEVVSSLPPELLLPNGLDALLKRPLPGHVLDHVDLRKASRNAKASAFSIGRTDPSACLRTHSLQDFVHEGGSLISSLHQVLLGSNDELGGQVVQREEHCPRKKTDRSAGVAVRESGRHSPQVVSRPTSAETPSSS